MNRFGRNIKLSARITGLIFLLSFAATVCGQTNVVINAANAKVLAGTNANVLGNITLQNNSTIDNSGTISLTNNWTNNAGSPGLINQSPGTVKLTGGSQYIAGAYSTDFYNLTLSGTGTKTLSANAQVLDTLALNDRQLATGTYTLSVTNTGTDVITRSTGYVSSDTGGSLVRNMLNTGSYLFPVGSNNIYKYRPVYLSGTTAGTQIFGVRMADNDPSLNGFDRNLLDTSLCSINNQFYHLINRVSGTGPVNLTLSYDSSVDGVWGAIGHWQTAGSWHNTGNYSTGMLSPLSMLTTNGWNNFNSTAFALATKNSIPVISPLGPLTFCAGDSVGLMANAGFQNYLWSNGESTQSISVKSAGNYYVTGSNANCSASSNRLAVSIYPVPPVSITESGDTLTSFGAISYQWYFNGQPIPGANSGTWVAAQSGQYTVQVTDTNGCNTRSNPISVNLNGINDLTNEAGMKVFPNPASAQLNVSCWGLTGEKVSMILYNILGEEVKRCNSTGSNSGAQLFTGDLSGGSYMLQLTASANRVFREKILLLNR